MESMISGKCMMDEKEKCWCNDTGISFFVMCCKEMPVTLFLACAGFEMTDVVHKIQKEIYSLLFLWLRRSGIGRGVSDHERCLYKYRNRDRL